MNLVLNTLLRIAPLGAAVAICSLACAQEGELLRQPYQVGSPPSAHMPARLHVRGKYEPTVLLGGFSKIGRIPGGATRYAGALAQLKSTGNGSGSGSHHAWTGQPTTLILYDTSSSWGWAGALYEQMIANLVGRFNVTVTSEPVESYQSGQLANFQSVFYIGTTYADPIPQAFLTDVMATNIPVCWIGYNLWQIAWNPSFTADMPAFTSKTGFRFVGVDTSGYPNVSYNGATFSRAQYDPTENATAVLNSSQATVLATSVNYNNVTIPYIIHGGNFYFVADNPFSYIQTQAMDRNMVFDDVIHMVLGTTLPTTRYAMLRIEDICPMYSAKEINGLTTVLQQEKIPFQMSVIPEYRDPLGYYNNGVSQSIELSKYGNLLTAIKNMQAAGGTIEMHGDTHQYDSVLNPYTGVSADDFEFFRVEPLEPSGSEVVGPVTEDSTAWCTSKITAGLAQFTAAGLTKPKGWNTPHYLASAADYAVFKSTFSYNLDRGLYFTTDSSGDLYWIQEPIPYTTTDVNGMLRYPETLGFCDPTGLSGAVWGPTQIVSGATAMKAISGGWASFYFHPYLAPSLLKQCIDGIKALGYTFVDPTKAN